MYEEEEFLSLSGLQHFAFCRRQWALIHIEQAWQENLLTVQGQFLHEKAHEAASEKRGAVIITRSMQVFSRELGIRGVCDIVELHRDDNGVAIHGRDGKYRPIPIEYKRGKPKEGEEDVLQPCAQAMCLEEMLVCEIPQGCLFYGETRRRLPIVFDEMLRKRVRGNLEEMHGYYRRGYTPRVRPSKACKACSLADLCLPRLGKIHSASDYLRSALSGEESE